MKDIPKELNWVHAIHACTLEKIFDKLRLEVQEDIRIRGKQREQDQWDGFQYSETPNAFTVSFNSNIKRATVTFTLDNHAIVVYRNGNVVFEATPTVNDLGECKLKVRGEEKELWQVRRLALENLFFEFAYEGY